MYRTTVNYVDTTTVGWTSQTALIICACAFVAALLIFFLIARMEHPTGKFTKKLKEFLNFRSIIIDGIIEFLYIFMAIVTTIASVYTMFSGVNYAVLQGLAGLVLGNLMLRVMFELIMLLVGLWQNTSDIRHFLEARHLKEFGTEAVAKALKTEVAKSEALKSAPKAEAKKEK